MNAMIGCDLPVDPGVVVPAGASGMEMLARHLAIGRDAAINRLDEADLRSLGRWLFQARAAQIPPAGDWQTWVILAGRGFGKTRAGAEWVRNRALGDGGVRIALVAATLAEARAVMVEGETGLLAITPPGEQRPRFEASNRRVIWPNKAQAFLYSAGEPESLRGAQHHFAWVDEIGKWPRATETWDHLAMGLRLGSLPRIVATSTPRATPLVRTLVAAATETGPVRLTRGRTIDNRAHLAEGFVALMERNYAGTAFGRQELDGELIEEVEGALWSRALIERCRIVATPAMVRVVIGVDPPAGAGASSDACGIVVVGLGKDGRAYVLADASVHPHPSASRRSAWRMTRSASAGSAGRGAVGYGAMAGMRR